MIVADRIAWRIRLVRLRRLAIPIWFATPENWDELRADDRRRAPRVSPTACGFEPKPGRVQILPDADGRRSPACCSASSDRGATGRDPLGAGQAGDARCPPAIYRFANAPHEPRARGARRSCSGSIASTRYHSRAGARPRLVAPEGVDAARIERIAAAVAFGRDLINTPANDLGPDALEPRPARSPRNSAPSVGSHARRRRCSTRNFPLIHAVGRAAPRRRASSTSSGGAPTRPR